MLSIEICNSGDSSPPLVYVHTTVVDKMAKKAIKKQAPSFYSAARATVMMYAVEESVFYTYILVYKIAFSIRRLEM